MTLEAQRIAIAEACGIDPNYATTIPDYLNDLNAMHEAEKKIDLEFYAPQLLAVIHEVGSDYFNKVSWQNAIELTIATSAQRAEAFLRTIGKWTATEEGK